MPETEQQRYGKRNLLFRGFAMFATFVVLAGICEVVLRLIETPKPTPELRLDEPTVHEPDPVLGWRNRAGHYEVPPYSRGADPVRLRFLKRGRRATSLAQRDDRLADRDGSLLVVGGSFAQGWAISDEETFSWRLQARDPRLEVHNYGTGGYGSYQSLLVLERELPQALNPEIVLYAFTGHHDTRSVAPWNWMKLLSDLSMRGHIDVPYATLDERGELVRHPPTRYVAWPGSDRFALARFLEHRTLALRDRLGLGRESQERPVAERALLHMHDISLAHGARLVVALLSARADKARHYERFLREREIAVVDCNAFPLPQEMIVLGEGHPNGRMNAEWADCIGDFLDRNSSTGFD